VSIVRFVQDRIGHLFHEIAKFGVVGGTALIVNIAVYHVYVMFNAKNVLTASIVASVVATVVAYLGNRYWTYKHRYTENRSSNRSREVVLFFVINGIASVIQSGCLALTHYVIGWNGPLGDFFGNFVLGTALGMIFRFWTYRTWIFPEAQPVLAADQFQYTVPTSQLDTFREPAAGQLPAENVATTR
jgi:putative flippase GtrA